MKCIIPGANIKVFGRSVHSLSRIGDELYVEPLQYGLALRTVNSSRSAYACFVFAPSFFQYYNDGTQETTDSEEETVKCKIGMKPCLSVFKSLSSLEKTVDRCKVTLDTGEARLIFQMYCKHGIVKTHNLAFIECETLQAVFSKDMCPNLLTAHSRLLADVVVNFQTTQEEVTLIVSPQKISLKNYVDDEPDPQKTVHTELSLDPDEFENFQVGIDTDVTFCLKELRAILSFTEATQLPLSIHFEGPGKPIVFSMDSDPSFEANFVLATLAEHAGESGTNQQGTQPHRTSTHMPSTASRSASISRSASASTRKPPAVKNRASTSHSKRTVNSNHELPKPTHNHKSPQRAPDQKEKQSSSNLNHGDGHQPRKPRERPHSKIQNVFEEFFNDEFDDVMMDAANRTEAEINQSEANNNQKEAENGPVDEHDDPPSPVIPYNHTKQTGLSTLNSCSLEHHDDSTTDDEDNNDDDEQVPGTPPNKKFKSLFFGLSQSTTAGSQQTAPVLAEDTDEED